MTFISKIYFVFTKNLNDLMIIKLYYIKTQIYI